MRRASFDSLLATLSSTFIQLPPDDVDAEIEHWLARIIEYLDIDRCAVVQRMDSDNHLHVTHICARPGLEKLRLSVIDDRFPWLTAKLKEGQIVSFSRFDDLPPEANQDAVAISGFGARSMAAIPFITGGENFGALIFTTIGREREWPQRIMQQLHLTVQVFASVLLRKRSELALRASEQRFAAAAKSSSDLIYEYDFKTDRHNIIGDIDRLLGYAPGEFPRTLKGWAAAIHPDDIAKFQSGAERFAATGEDFVISYRMGRKDGTYLHWEDRGTAVARENGTPVRLVGACTDITARLKAEADARELRDQLHRVSRVSTLGELTATLAHEINQPLAAILSNAQAALRLLDVDEPDLAEVRAALADIVSDDQRAGNVIRKIREFLRSHHLETGPVSINDLVNEVLALVRNELPAHGIRLKRYLARTLPPVTGDGIQIQQVILNLVINAMEAMTGQPERFPRDLEVHTSKSDSFAAVSIRDTGKGIEASASDSIFDPFVTTKDGGMGLGLSICKSIIEGHGGKLSARNRRDRGSAFYFTLPLFKTKTPPERTAEDEKE